MNSNLRAVVAVGNEKIAVGEHVATVHEKNSAHERVGAGKLVQNLMQHDYGA